MPIATYSRKYTYNYRIQLTLLSLCCSLSDRASGFAIRFYPLYWIKTGNAVKILVAQLSIDQIRPMCMAKNPVRSGKSQTRQQPDFGTIAIVVFTVLDLADSSCLTEEKIFRAGIATVDQVAIIHVSKRKSRLRFGYENIFEGSDEIVECQMNGNPKAITSKIFCQPAAWNLKNVENQVL